MKTKKYILPASWACALVNRDWSGLTDADSRAAAIAKVESGEQ